MKIKDEISYPYFHLPTYYNIRVGKNKDVLTMFKNYKLYDKIQLRCYSKGEDGNG